MGTEEAIEVELIDGLGTDLTVVNSARVSFKKESEFEYKSYYEPVDSFDHSLDEIKYDSEGKKIYVYKVLNEKDKKLIKFLAREGHTTPFRHVQLQFRCKAPIFLARQLGKHQVGMVWNEVSRRYVDEEPEFYFPDCWRERPKDGIKQGSGEECINIGAFLSGQFGNPTNMYIRAVTMAEYAYKWILEKGVAPEMARMVLPQSMLTEWIWTGSLYGFFNVWKQRADDHAQEEAQYFAELIDYSIPDDLRFSWEALKEYRP